MIPELERHCGSWIIVSKDTGKAVFETFQRSVVRKVDLEKYRVLTASQYLADLNYEIREAGNG